MITQDELECFIDELIEPLYVAEARDSGCSSDACPINFGGSNDNK